MSLWSDRQRLASRLQVKRAETRLKLPRQTPGTFPSALFRAELGKGSGQGGGRKGGRGSCQEAAREKNPDSKPPSRRKGEDHFLQYISLVFIFIFFFILLCWQLYPNQKKNNNKTRAFSPCLHLGSCFPPAPENVTPS